MANLFRLLRADEIEARISTVGKKGISLLLYIVACFTGIAKEK